ncbi:MAG: MATE family efflux transporter [Phycisphaerales bacterium]|jgi:putative MATE family efflux protein|nr:MATE family efflux transporter [Phycisphaerales bacterium]MDP6312085.1 MATE family efflux transporter [Phycisphaerales bacterium]MDP7087044.1 MATE family efflux transporter [Phycisphaerales bacterium]MDP7189938.1 MATE family efflux transporter [Phycisphaerales bacterium]MDP7519146.1 MATE family efflux transporter [Phycisphaerales bacterium]|tara:strand:+ start:47 stop:1567 length:1521 start_codon:yes stop_codon:yes gene_type:complete
MVDGSASEDDAPEAVPQPTGRIQSGALVGRSLLAGILIVGLPVLLQQILGATVGLVDKMLAGGLDDTIVLPAMDGLGAGSYVAWFIGISMSGLGIGGQAIIARAIGRGDVKEAEHALGQAMGMSVVWGVLVSVAFWWLAAPLAAVCGLNGEAATYLVEYVHVLAYSMPFCGLMMVGAMCLTGAGETIRPAVIAVIVNVVNVIFSWLLSGAELRLFGIVLPDMFGFDMDVAGIAAGTAIGYGVGGVLMVGLLLWGVRDLRLRVPLLNPVRSMIFRVARVGIPNFLEGISMWSANLGVLAMIGVIAGREARLAVTAASSTDAVASPTAGEGLVGAHIIAVQWESFSFLPGFAIGTAAAALAGQFLGAGNVAMARRAVFVCTGIAVALMGLLGIVYMLFGQSLTELISTQAKHLGLVPQLLFICGITQVFFAVSMVVRQALRGLGDTVWTFAITTISSYGIRLPAAWIFGIVLDLGLIGVWIALCGELAVRACLFLARFLHGGWATRKV